jgi:butyryl-CoA dehydrogenase
MDLSLSPEEQMVQQSARDFARQELRPVAAELDARAQFPKAQVDRMFELGLMGMMVPEAYGGAGMSTVAYALAVEEISAGCASCGVIMSVNNSLCCDPLVKYAAEPLRALWLPKLCSGAALGCFALSEPGTGSDAAAQTCVATPTVNGSGSGWILHGTKNWITNGAQADVCVVMAMTDRSLGVKGISAFLVPTDTPGFSVAKNEHKLGIRASSTSQVHLDQVRLPADHLMGQPGDGFKIAMGTLDGGRIGIASQALGIAVAAYDAARRYARERQAFGGPIGNLQAIGFMLADMALEIDAARLLIWRAAVGKDRKERYGPHAARAKLYASEMANRVTYKALQIFGGNGYCTDYPLERHSRDARITTIYEGTSEIQRVVIARDVLQNAI